MMAEDKNGTRHVSYEQVKVMLDFMGQNIEFATGSLRTLEARHTSKRLWGELTKVLNDCRIGTKKTSDGWSKYWSDFKNKLKNKAKILKKRKRGLSLDKSVKPLTKLEKRALTILGPHFEKKLIRIQLYDDKISNDIPPEVKLEAYQDNNDFCKSQVDSNDRLSGGENSFESDESSQSSNEEYEEDTDPNSNEPLVHNLYPKWLIEVEKKRADAELLRATAEEKRARASAKSAEAALIQAEALKKLADAAATQANALMRIAAAIENRRPIDDGLSVSSTASIPGYSI